MLCCLFIISEPPPLRSLPQQYYLRVGEVERSLCETILRNPISCPQLRERWIESYAATPGHRCFKPEGWSPSHHFDPTRDRKSGKIVISGRQLSLGRNKGSERQKTRRKYIKQGPVRKLKDEREKQMKAETLEGLMTGCSPSKPKGQQVGMCACTCTETPGNQENRDDAGKRKH